MQHPDPECMGCLLFTGNLGDPDRGLGYDPVLNEPPFRGDKPRGDSAPQRRSRSRARRGVSKAVAFVSRETSQAIPAAGRERRQRSQFYGSADPSPRKAGHSFHGKPKRGKEWQTAETTPGTKNPSALVSRETCRAIAPGNAGAEALRLVSRETSQALPLAEERGRNGGRFPWLGGSEPQKGQPLVSRETCQANLSRRAPALRPSRLALFHGKPRRSRLAI